MNNEKMKKFGFTRKIFFFQQTNGKRTNIAQGSTRYGSRPACLKSLSTSWEGGQWPLAPLAPGSSSKDIATARSRSRTMTLVVTRPPASRQMRAVTVSRAYPLLPKTPARAQAARWWPQASSGRPHRQERTVKGRGRWRRRNRMTLKS